MRPNLAKGATWAVKHKHKPGRVLSSSQKRHNKKYSDVPAKVEHAFRVIKCQFGSRKVRYRRLFKNTAQMLSLIVLANLDLARRSLRTVSALNPKIRLKSPQKWAQKCGCRAWGGHLAISSPRRTRCSGFLWRIQRGNSSNNRRSLLFDLLTPIRSIAQAPRLT